MSLPKPEVEIASVVVDHPIHPGWFTDGLSVIDHAQPQPKQFERFEGYASVVIGALNIASRRTDSARYIHEQANVTKLLLTPEEHEEYLRLAGNPSVALDYIRWFERRANEAFTHISYMANVHDYYLRTNSGIKAGNIAVELFGERQRGNWDTQVVDSLARKVPEILAAHAGAEVRTYDDPEHPKFLGHYFIPQYDTVGGDGTKFDFGTVRRRRMLADIVLDGVKIELFKESTGVVVLKYVPEETGKAIKASFATPAQARLAMMRDSVPARLVGEVFAEAIADKKNALTVVPMSIQDIMLVRAPQVVLDQAEALQNRKPFDL